ncbi:hypothetical protein EYF80_004056 [Liparis tanakae]|uniref:Uncharacterized protein n=1 Tax=Liparis tanakae TaxID=230148 RepID=A0A4Z2J6J9_9TELE|nr:hypothetical protein EYF80_004056 [Liparis tanakae]
MAEQRWTSPELACSLICFRGDAEHRSREALSTDLQESRLLPHLCQLKSRGHRTRMNGSPASSCGLCASVQVPLCVRDTRVSLWSLLKSPRVDVEDFDGVVGAGAGELDPGVLVLDVAPSVILSVWRVVLVTCSAGPGPPAEPLDRQSVALSARVHVMKGNHGTPRVTDR